MKTNYDFKNINLKKGLIDKKILLGAFLILFSFTSIIILIKHVNTCEMIIILLTMLMYILVPTYVNKIYCQRLSAFYQGKYYEGTVCSIDIVPSIGFVFYMERPKIEIIIDGKKIYKYLEQNGKNYKIGQKIACFYNAGTKAILFPEALQKY